MKTLTAICCLLLFGSVDAVSRCYTFSATQIRNSDLWYKELGYGTATVSGGVLTIATTGSAGAGRKLLGIDLPRNWGPTYSVIWNETDTAADEDFYMCFVDRHNGYSNGFVRRDLAPATSGTIELGRRGRYDAGTTTSTYYTQAIGNFGGGRVQEVPAFGTYETAYLKYEVFLGNITPTTSQYAQITAMNTGDVFGPIPLDDGDPSFPDYPFSQYYDMSFRFYADSASITYLVNNVQFCLNEPPQATADNYQCTGAGYTCYNSELECRTGQNPYSVSGTSGTDVYLLNAWALCGSTNRLVTNVKCTSGTDTNCRAISDGLSTTSYASASFTCGGNNGGCYTSKSQCTSGKGATGTWTGNTWGAAVYQCLSYDPNNTYLRCGSTATCYDISTGVQATSYTSTQWSCSGTNTLNCYPSAGACQLNMFGVTTSANTYGSFNTAVNTCLTQLSTTTYLTCAASTNCVSVSTGLIATPYNNTCDAKVSAYQLKTNRKDGWFYVNDSPVDGTDLGSLVGYASNYEFYGMAIKVSADYVAVYLDTNMPLIGAAVSSAATDGYIGYGDFFTTYSFQNQVFTTLSNANSLRAIHFIPAAVNSVPVVTDSGVTVPGLYTGVNAKSVTAANSGWTSWTAYQSGVATHSGSPTPSAGNTNGVVGYTTTGPETIVGTFGTFFTTSDPIYTSINTGTLQSSQVFYVTSYYDKPVDPYFRTVDNVNILTIGKSFNHPTSWYGKNPYTFILPKASFPDGYFRGHILTECANDNLFIEVLVDPDCYSQLEEECLAFINPTTVTSGGNTYLRFDVIGYTYNSQQQYEWVIINWTDPVTLAAQSVQMQVDVNKQISINLTALNIPKQFSITLKERPYCSAVITDIPQNTTVTKTSPVDSTFSIGEVGTFTVVVSVPPSYHTSAVFTDVIPTGLTYVTGTLAISASSVTTSFAGGFSAAAAAATLSGSTLTAPLGNLLVNVAAGGTLTFTYQLRQTSAATGVEQNCATFGSSDISTVQGCSTVTGVISGITTSVALEPSTSPNCAPVAYTFNVANTMAATDNAYNLACTMTWTPAQFSTATPSYTAQTTPSTSSGSGTVTYTWTTYALGSTTITISLNAQVSSSLAVGATVGPVNLSCAWSSLPNGADANAAHYTSNAASGTFTVSAVGSLVSPPALTGSRILPTTGNFFSSPGLTDNLVYTLSNTGVAGVTGVSCTLTMNPSAATVTSVSVAGSGGVSSLNPTVSNTVPMTIGAFPTAGSATITVGYTAGSTLGLYDPFVSLLCSYDGACAAQSLSDTRNMSMEAPAQTDGDPHFLAFDGSTFLFNGEASLVTANNPTLYYVYGIISDHSFQLNGAFFYVANSHWKGNTVLIKDVGIITHGTTLQATFNPNTTPVSGVIYGKFDISINGTPLTYSNGLVQVLNTNGDKLWVLHEKHIRIYSGGWWVALRVVGHAELNQGRIDIFVYKDLSTNKTPLPHGVMGQFINRIGSTPLNGGTDLVASGVIADSGSPPGSNYRIVGDNLLSTTFAFSAYGRYTFVSTRRSLSYVMEDAEELAALAADCPFENPNNSKWVSARF